MTNKEQILKTLEGRIDTATNLMIECFELIYNAGYNEGVDAAAKEASSWGNFEETQIKALKK